jgi:hypothetical protein
MRMGFIVSLLHLCVSLWKKYHYLLPTSSNSHPQAGLCWWSGMLLFQSENWSGSLNLTHYFCLLPALGSGLASTGTVGIFLGGLGIISRSGELSCLSQVHWQWWLLSQLTQGQKAWKRERSWGGWVWKTTSMISLSIKAVPSLRSQFVEDPAQGPVMSESRYRIGLVTCA